jgi:hypothetical protein
LPRKRCYAAGPKQKQGLKCGAGGLSDRRGTVGRNKRSALRPALAEHAVGRLPCRTRAAQCAYCALPAFRWQVVRSQEGQNIVNIATGDRPVLETGDGDPSDEIARLEERLEELADAMTRCRKIRLISQIAITAGGMWMLAVTVGVLGFDPIAMMAAISGVIGGTVMYGSNRTTWREVDAAINDAEAKRAELIGRLDLRVVGEGKY